MPTPARTLKLVIDTNVLVSAVLSRTSAPGRVVKYSFEVAIVLCTLQILEEFREVIRRPKFAKLLSSISKETAIKVLLEQANYPIVSATVTDCRDLKDNKFLALALDGGADAIITGDQDLLVLHPWRGIDILTPADFLSRLETAGAES